MVDGTFNRYTSYEALTIHIETQLFDNTRKHTDCVYATTWIIFLNQSHRKTLYRNQINKQNGISKKPKKMLRVYNNSATVIVPTGLCGRVLCNRPCRFSSTVGSAAVVTNNGGRLYLMT